MTDDKDLRNRDIQQTDVDKERREDISNVADDYNEEAAAEVTPIVTPINGAFGSRPVTVPEDDRREERTVETSGRGVGTFAIVLSILSLFFLPVIMGAAGIILGFVARRNGANALGGWAIGIGVISIIMTLFFSPFF